MVHLYNTFINFHLSFVIVCASIDPKNNLACSFITLFEIYIFEIVVEEVI